MSSAQTDLSSSVDGRNLRRQRNRQAIVNALLELYEEGRIDVSAALIVQRAGLSERSLFRYFDDLNDLYRTACDTHFERMSKYAVIDAYTRGSLTEKIEHFVEQRARVFIATRNIAIVTHATSHLCKNSYNEGEPSCVSSLSCTFNQNSLRWIALNDSR